MQRGLAPPEATARLRARPSTGRGRRCGVVRANMPPNKEWPPADVWEDFRKAESGEWEGHAMKFAPNGGAVPLPSNYVPESFKDYDVGVSQWAVRSTTPYGGEGGIDKVDTFATQTRYLWPEAGCEFGKEDVAVTRDDAYLGGGQMGKMCIVDGDYSSGPMVLPPCEEGARVRFEFGFMPRVPMPDEEEEEASQGGAGLPRPCAGSRLTAQCEPSCPYNHSVILT
jgi:hypothetical protein